MKPRNSFQKKHIGGLLGGKQEDKISEMFPAKLVLSISEDDQAKVLLGLTISKKKTVILMYLKYKVTLSGHSFPAGSQYKFISSVMAASLKRDRKKIGYIGPILISVMSQKHDTPCAQSHMEDFDTLVAYEEIRETAKTADGQVKQLVIPFVFC